MDLLMGVMAAVRKNIEANERDNVDDDCLYSGKTAIHMLENFHSIFSMISQCCRADRMNHYIYPSNSNCIHV